MLEASSQTRNKSLGKSMPNQSKSPFSFSIYEINGLKSEFLQAESN